MRNYFEFVNTAKIKCGDNAVQTLGFELSRYGSERPLVILSLEVVRSGIAGRAIASVNEDKNRSAVLFDGVPKMLSVDIVREMKQLFEKEKCDSVVAIGGTSVIDSAKLLKVLLSENSEDISGITGQRTAMDGRVPAIFLPTEICGGAELNGMIEENDAFISSPEMVPNAVIIDKEIAETDPFRLTAEGVVYALANAVEAYIGASEDDLSEIYAEKAVKLIVKYGKKATERAGSKEATAGVGLASALSGVAFGNLPFGAAHALADAIHDITGESKQGAMSHVLVGALKAADQKAKARIDELMARYNIEATEGLFEKSADISGGEAVAAPSENTDAEERAPESGEATGANEEAEPSEGVRKIERLVAELARSAGITNRLSLTDIPRESFGAIAEAAQGKRAAVTATRTFNKEDFLVILNAAY